MANVYKKSSPWRRINLSTNGYVTTVRYTDLTGGDLVILFTAALEKVPLCEEAMELALKKHKEPK